jgi:hypothetical protein
MKQVAYAGHAEAREPPGVFAAALSRRGGRPAQRAMAYACHAPMRLTQRYGVTLCWD